MIIFKKFYILKQKSLINPFNQHNNLKQLGKAVKDLVLDLVRLIIFVSDKLPLIII